MDRHAGKPHFMAGDVVSIPPFSVRHEMNLDEVRAIFQHEGGEHNIVLSGIPTVEARPQEMSTASGPRLFRFGRVGLEGEISGQDLPGEYVCARLIALSAGGNEVPFEDVPDFSFVVALEPSRRPIIAGEISLRWLTDHFHGGVYDPEKDEHIRPQWDKNLGKFIDSE